VISYRNLLTVEKNNSSDNISVKKPNHNEIDCKLLLSNNDVQNSKKRLVYYYFGIKIWSPSLRHQLAHAEENNFVVIEKLAKKNHRLDFIKTKNSTYKVEAFELVMDWFLNRFWISGIGNLGNREMGRRRKFRKLIFRPFSPNFVSFFDDFSNS